MKKGQEKAQTDLNWVHLYLKDGTYPPGLTAIEKRIVRKRAEQFCFMNDELFFLGTLKSREIGQVARKVLLTHEEKWDVVVKAHVHYDGTHLGLERTLEAITDKYYWVGTHKFTRDYIRQCQVCLEKNPRLGAGTGPSTSVSITHSVADGSFDDGSSFAGDDSLSISGTEVVSTSDDVESLYDQSQGFVRGTAKHFWELVDLRLYGPFKALVKSKYVLIALDGFSLWPEAFVLDTISPSSLAHSLLKLVCRYGQMGKLVISQEDEVLETASLKALELLKQEGSIDIELTKCIVDNTGELYEELEELLTQFVTTYQKTWTDCIEYCLLPLRSSCPQRADYTPAFLAHSREIQLPAVLVQNYAPDTQASDKSPMLEPFMTVTQKKMTIDEVMSINEAIVKESSKTLVLSEEKFAVPTPDKSVVPTPDKSVDAKSIDTSETTSGGIMTRTRTGTVKPKQFDGEKFITPVKRKASTPTPVVPTEVKRVRVVPEVILEPPEPVDSPEKEEKGNNPSDSESDLTEAADKADKKLTVDLDFFYQSIKHFIITGTYLPNSSFNLRRLIRETTRQYKLQDSELFYISDSNKLPFKVIASKEDRLDMLDWAHIKHDGHLGRAEMLEELSGEEVHWKGKSFDCETFALACPDCENYEKRIKYALKNMQEEKKLVIFDNCKTYNEIREFLSGDVFSKCVSESLMGIKKHLNSFKVENDQLMYITDMSKKRVVTSPAERVKLIRDAHIHGDKHLDLKWTLSRVQGECFWFGMKLDVKIFVTYCCGDGDGKYLIDRYFMFRAHFMKKSLSQNIEIVKRPSVTVVHAQTTTDEAEFTASKVDDIAGNETVDDDLAGKEDHEKPTGIFVSTITPEATRTKPTEETAVEVVVAPRGQEITEEGDNIIVLKKASSDEEEKNFETDEQRVIVTINEGGDAISSKVAEFKLTSLPSVTNVTNSNSDPVTMAAVKSILPDVTGAVRDVLNEVEVGGVNNSPSKTAEISTAVEMKDSSANTSVELVVNEDDLLDDDTDDDEDEEDDDDDEDTVEVPSMEIRSELLSRLTESLTPTVVKQEEPTPKKEVKPRQYFKCNICNRVFYGPNKFKTHIYRHTGQKPFPCTMCNKKYTNNKSLQIHERTHTGELPYLCNTCGKRMPSKMSLKSHMKVHDGRGGGMPCRCDICGREFTRRHLMERHKNFKHINLQTEFKCSECPKIFGHQRSLKRHFMSHHMGVKNHVCELCNKGFYRKEYLTSHMAQHSGIPGYTLEPSKKKRSPRSYKSYVKEEMVMDEDESREDTEPVRRIILHQDEHGTLRVVDVATEREVKKMLDSQIVQRSEVGDTMVVQIQQPASEVERHVIQIQQPDNVVEQQVLEIEQPDHQEEQVVHVENDGQTAEQVVEVPMEEEGYISYQQIEESPGSYITVSANSANTAPYTFAYSSSQADISAHANQELIYGQPAVQYEVECVGDEEALSAINLLAQASAAQYESAAVSKIQ